MDRDQLKAAAKVEEILCGTPLKSPAAHVVKKVRRFAESNQQQQQDIEDASHEKQ